VVTCAFNSVKNCSGPVIETQGILLTSLDLSVQCFICVPTCQILECLS
jgi:hypothetical protein